MSLALTWRWGFILQRRPTSSGKLVSISLRRSLLVFLLLTQQILFLIFLSLTICLPPSSSICLCLCIRRHLHLLNYFRVLLLQLILIFIKFLISFSSVLSCCSVLNSYLLPIVLGKTENCILGGFPLSLHPFLCHLPSPFIYTSSCAIYPPSTTPPGLLTSSWV